VIVVRKKRKDIILTSIPLLTIYENEKILCTVVDGIINELGMRVTNFDIKISYKQSNSHIFRMMY
jgi:hypothetical protein